MKLPEGYRPTKGRRNPPADSGPYYVCLRNGLCPPEPWPVKGTRWKWGEREDPFDIVGVKVAD